MDKWQKITKMKTKQKTKAQIQLQTKMRLTAETVTKTALKTLPGTFHRILLPTAQILQRTVLITHTTLLKILQIMMLLTADNILSQKAGGKCRPPT